MRAPSISKWYPTVTYDVCFLAEPSLLAERSRKMVDRYLPIYKVYHSRIR
jgi:hypothetical protein